MEVFYFFDSLGRKSKKGGEGLYLQLNDLKKVEGTNYRLKVTRLAKEVFP
jgi:hypothetical protein